MNLIHPEVLSLQLPEKSENFMQFLNHIWAFDSFKTTDEDINRNSRYKQEKQRKDEQKKYGTLNDFIDSLKIKVEVKNIVAEDIDRAVQLSMRTNQFNLNGIVKTYDLIANSIKIRENLNWVIDVKDRFGDYGVVGFLQAYKKGSKLILETFMLSCRVLGRNVEEIILTELQNHCLQLEITEIVGLFKSTDKNQPIKNFLELSGWVYNSESKLYHFAVKGNLPSQ